MGIGELFILGFRGKELPRWLLDFEDRFGLGGVILFDYNCQTKTYDNNIENSAQLKNLCTKISSLKSRPLIFVDQEGGKVRRLKESRGFAPLPSALTMNRLSLDERRKFLLESFRELVEIGIDFNFAPVIDLNTNPLNPDIGAVERSFSANSRDVEDNALLVQEAAAETGLGLCLKHYPGLGGATTNSHYDLTDLSDSISDEQLDLFWRLAPKMSGSSILVSHGIVKQWDPELPTSISPSSIGFLRKKLPDVLLISDDMQMQGLQQKMSTHSASVRGLLAGLDMICIGNNLMAEDEEVAATAEELLAYESRLTGQIKRVQQRKAKFKR